MQGGNRNANLESGHVNTAGEREVGKNWEIGIAYTLPCGLYTLPYTTMCKTASWWEAAVSTGSSAQWSVMTQGSGMEQRWEGSSRGGRYRYALPDFMLLYKQNLTPL